MFASFRRAFGNIKVYETKTLIHVEGIPADVLQRDMARVWRTSKIAMHMFNSFGRSSFSFHKFFAQDIVYMIDTLLQSRAGVSVRVLNAIRKELFEHTWLKNTLPSPDSPGRLRFENTKRFKKQPLPHQREFMEVYSTSVDRMGLNGLLAAAAAGSGKTLLSLNIAECAEAEFIIVICPKNATQRVWEKTIQEEYHNPPSYWLAQYGKPYKGERILIAHYEALATVVELVRSKAVMSENIAVILDESHNLNEIKSQRTQLWIELCQLTKSRNIIPASGTPVKAMGAELIPLLKVLDPLFTEAVEERFKKIFGKDGNKGLEILKNRLGLVSYKIEKAALGLDKPIMKTLPIKMPTGNQYTLPAIKQVMEKFIQERVEYYKKRRKDDEAFWNKCIELHEQSLKNRVQKDEYAKYKAALKTVIKNPDPRYIGEEIAYTNVYEKRFFEPTLPKEMIKQFRDVKSVIKYTQLKIQGECLGRVLGRKRIECHVDMVRYIDFVDVVESTLKKTVVFTSFVEALVAAQEHTTSLGLKPLVVYGKTNNELAAIVKRFEQDENLNPLVATYNSLSTAVPLVMADTMIMINSPFRAYIEEQAISRIHRLGADTQTTVYRCHLDTGETPNISTRSSEILAWSQAMVEEITGVKSPFAITESLEHHQDVTQLDDTHMFNTLLSTHYARFGIEIPMEAYIDGLPQATPGFMRW